MRRTDPRRLTFDRGKKEISIGAYGLDTLSLGRNEVDTRSVEQWAEEGQLEACGWIIKKLKRLLENNEFSNIENIQKIFRELQEQGIESLAPYNTGRLSLPRVQEVMAALNRIR